MDRKLRINYWENNTDFSSKVLADLVEFWLPFAIGQVTIDDLPPAGIHPLFVLVRERSAFKHE